MTTRQRTEMADELRARMARAQRHRLLNGHPMPPLMQLATDPPPRPSATDRPTIVGVLPHPFCNPRVEGCGYCTFPHEKHSNDRAREIAKRVVAEIEAAPLEGRDVRAVYLGGGTANLTPPDAFEAIVSALRRRIGSSVEEITLEGVPAYFLGRDGALLRTLVETGWPPRISMGVQTFDREWLDRMGRAGFGDRETVREVVARARSLGATTSADLLVNLPGQPYAAMSRDVHTAMELGLDQICVYHLVLSEGLGTAWSRDPALLASLPPNDVACDQWLRLRRELLDAGYEQTTLTNFERRGARRFVYERRSFAPWDHDALGFGPGAISTFDGLKTIHVGASRAYVAWMDAGRSPVSKRFDYTPADLDVLYLTRGLATTRVALSRLAAPESFMDAIVACEDEGLVALEAGEL
ncbi:MAG: radical SAM protein, partial [Myxococcales bacterium]|nr:radical SAM protein [Myxococcales bacterium]